MTKPCNNHCRIKYDYYFIALKFLMCSKTLKFDWAFVKSVLA